VFPTLPPAPACFCSNPTISLCTNTKHEVTDQIYILSYLGNPLATYYSGKQDSLTDVNCVDLIQSTTSYFRFTDRRMFVKITEHVGLEEGMRQPGSGRQ